MKNIKISILIMLVLVIFTVGADAQALVGGKVTADGEPLPGVTILIKGTQDGTVTNANGRYELNAESDEILVFRFIGYLTEEIQVGSQSEINVELSLDIAQLDEVVVVGYGSQRKKEITGAISVVETEELQKSNFLNVTDRLQGRVAGVTVNTSGEPGSVGEITIRGSSFAVGSNRPLYVIDGILTDDSPNLNPNDIESIQVLKDASATAIYGNRAANGVIVITTKGGKPGQLDINLSANVGIQQVTNKIDVMGAEDYARIANAAGSTTIVPEGVDTDWQEQVFNDQALFQDFNLSLSGGGEKSTAYFSLNSAYQEGVIQGPLFERLTARLNTTFEPIKGLVIGENFTIGQAKSSGEQGFVISDFGGDGVIVAAQGMLPNIPVLDPTKLSGYGHGVSGVANSFIPNPVGLREMFKNKGSSTKVLGNIFANYKFLDGFEYDFRLGIDADVYRTKNFNRNGQIRLATIHQSGLTEERGESYQIFWENRLKYSKSIGNHNFSAMVSYTDQSGKFSQQSTSINMGFQDQDDRFFIDASSATPNQVTNSGGEAEFGIRSILGRVTYNYKDRYYFTGNFRRDGSSVFGPNNKWDNFPSVSVGWNITNEPFFNIPQIANLKVRAGYGQVGNADIGNYAYQERIVRTSNFGVNYNLGPSSTPVIGATRLAVVDPNITWMSLEELNFGIDLALFDGKLEIIGDYYTGNLDDLLFTVPIPLSAGPGRSEEEDGVITNAVSAKRNGWEAQVVYRKREGDFKFNISANLFHTNNEIETLPFGVDEFFGGVSISRPGLPVGQFFLLDYQGIYTQEDIDNLPAGFTVFGDDPLVGNANYADVNGRDENGVLTGQPDGQVNNDDRKLIDANPIPDVQYGLSFEASYKNFDLMVFFQGVAGRDVYNSLYQGLNSDVQTNFTADFDPYIEDEGGTEPQIFAGTANIGGSRNNSTRYLENGDYIRLKNIQIGYTVPWLDKVQLRAFVSAQNLFTITDYRGADPEFDGGYFDPGADPRGFPNLRTYSAGFNLNF